MGAKLSLAEIKSVPKLSLGTRKYKEVYSRLAKDFLPVILRWGMRFALPSYVYLVGCSYQRVA
jgi:hypothetical protein